MLKKWCMSKIQKMFRYLSHDLDIKKNIYIYIDIYIYICDSARLKCDGARLNAMARGYKRWREVSKKSNGPFVWPI